MSLATTFRSDGGRTRWARAIPRIQIASRDLKALVGAGLLTNDAVKRSLDALRTSARTTENLMPRILDAVRAYATVGEMCDALREVWGEYEEVPII